MQINIFKVFSKSVYWIFLEWYLMTSIKAGKSDSSNLIVRSSVGTKSKNTKISQDLYIRFF